MTRRALLLLLLLSSAPACTRDSTTKKAKRILALDDRRLTDVVSAWLVRPGAAETVSERTLGDVIRVFEIVGDTGLSPFVEDPAVTDPRPAFGGSVVSPERARDSLVAVGLSQHAKVFTDLLSVRVDGHVPHATLLALEDRFRNLPDPAPTIAAYIRAHAADIHLAKVNEKAVPSEVP